MEPENLGQNVTNQYSVPAPEQTAPVGPQFNSPKGNKTPVIIAVVVLLLIIGGAIWYFGLSNKGVNQKSEQKKFTKEELSLPINVSVDYYKSIKPLELSANQIPKDAVIAGPTYVSLKNNEIEIISAPVPNLAGKKSIFSDSQISLLTFDSIIDRKGKSYKGDDADEDFFNVLSWDILEDPSLGIRMSTSRRWYSMNGDKLKDEDIASIKGRLILNLPVDVAEISFGVDEVGKTKTANGVSVTMNNISKSVDAEHSMGDYFVEYTFNGKDSLLQETRAYSNNNYVESVGSTGIPVSEDSLGAEKGMELYFSEPVDKVTLYIAKEIYHVEFPFTVNNSLSAPTYGTETKNDTKSSSLSDKDQIIKAILNASSVMKSADVKKIRAYLNSIAPVEERRELEKSSDKELLEVASYISSMTGDISEEKLRSGDAVWQIGETEASVKVKGSDGSTNTYSSRKVNGVWY